MRFLPSRETNGSRAPSGAVFTALRGQIHIYIKIYSLYIYIYIECSVFKYCDRNVYFTEKSRTQVADNFVETFEQSVLKLRGSVTQ